MLALGVSALALLALVLSAAGVPQSVRLGSCPGGARNGFETARLAFLLVLVRANKVIKNGRSMWEVLKKTLKNMPRERR